MALPSETRSAFVSLFAISASRHAEHSTAEPLASSKNWLVADSAVCHCPQLHLTSRQTRAVELIANLAIGALLAVDLFKQACDPCHEATRFDKRLASVIEGVAFHLHPPPLVLRPRDVPSTEDEDENEGRDDGFAGTGTLSQFFELEPRTRTKDEDDRTHGTATNFSTSSSTASLVRPSASAS